ncbi:MAG: metallophosphoesterase, partial [Alphaproteobacteria bacterium]|nr:metallophosphoesterase [Alphaproteobacteria bacterium]
MRSTADVRSSCKQRDPALSRAKDQPNKPPSHRFGGRLRRFLSGRTESRAIPDGMRVYAVGDVHGCLAQLSALLAKIEADASGFAGEIQPIFLGDYVDRGPDSKGVIDRLLAAREERDCRFIRGNHDQFMLDFLEQPALYRDWRDFGGRETLLSYGVVPPLFDNDRA